VKREVRPVLNVSGPAGHSFNGCVDSSKREKVKMDAAGSFIYKLREADKGACMDKTDLTDAFKSMPAKLEDLRMNAKFFVKHRISHYNIVECRPNECIFGSGKTPGGRDFG
jgi:hypothetical protein